MPGVARLGDSNVPHCSGHNVGSASNNVFVNGRGAARRGDSTTVHVKPGGDSCPAHTATVSGGSRTVFVNGRPVARIGDGYGGCTSIASGSRNVFSG